MAVQLDYIAPDGWQPENPDEEYVLVQFKMQLADNVPESAFRDAAASVAAESSTGTWTKVEDRPDSGMEKANEYKAIAYDIDQTNHMFKVAYRTNLFEYDNLSGFLAGPVGNIAGMKMERGIRIFDIRFPRKMVEAFPGPRYGVDGVRNLLDHNDEQRKIPILGTVPKPKVGRSDLEQAQLARRLWTASDGSYDFIKDDENLTSLPFNKFDDRCRNVLAVQRELEEQGGKKKIYLCNVTHSNIDTMMARANLIKEQSGRCMMIDVVTTGFAAVHFMRLHNPELIMHGHRAMHGFITRESGVGISGEGELKGFSVAMVVLAKMYRLLGIDSLHVGSPKAKMEDYGESEMIAQAMLSDITEPDPRFKTLGQNWFGKNKTWPVASGGLHPGVLDRVVEKFGPNCYIQLGGGVLGHPEGAERGVEAAIEARKAIAQGMTIKEFVEKNPDTALAKAVELWGTEPKIVY